MEVDSSSITTTKVCLDEDHWIDLLGTPLDDFMKTIHPILSGGSKFEVLCDYEIGLPALNVMLIFRPNQEFSNLSQIWLHIKYTTTPNEESFAYEVDLVTTEIHPSHPDHGMRLPMMVPDQCKPHVDALRQYAEKVFQRARHYCERLSDNGVIHDTSSFLKVDLFTCPLCHGALSSCADFPGTAGKIFPGALAKFQVRPSPWPTSHLPLLLTVMATPHLWRELTHRFLDLAATACRCSETSQNTGVCVATPGTDAVLLSRIRVFPMHYAPAVQQGMPCPVVVVTNGYAHCALQLGTSHLSANVPDAARYTASGGVATAESVLSAKPQGFAMTVLRRRTRHQTAAMRPPTLPQTTGLRFGKLSIEKASHGGRGSTEEIFPYDIDFATSQNHLMYLREDLPTQREVVPEQHRIRAHFFKLAISPAPYCSSASPIILIMNQCLHASTWNVQNVQTTSRPNKSLIDLVGAPALLVLSQNAMEIDGNSIETTRVCLNKDYSIDLLGTQLDDFMKTIHPMLSGGSKFEVLCDHKIGLPALNVILNFRPNQEFSKLSQTSLRVEYITTLHEEFFAYDLDLVTTEIHSSHPDHGKRLSMMVPDQWRLHVDELRQYAENVFQGARHYCERLSDNGVIHDPSPFLAVDLLTCPLCYGALSSCADSPGAVGKIFPGALAKFHVPPSPWYPPTPLPHLLAVMAIPHLWRELTHQFLGLAATACLCSETNQNTGVCVATPGTNAVLLSRIRVFSMHYAPIVQQGRPCPVVVVTNGYAHCALQLGASHLSANVPDAARHTASGGVATAESVLSANPQGFAMTVLRRRTRHQIRGMQTVYLRSLLIEKEPGGHETVQGMQTVEDGPADHKAVQGMHRLYLRSLPNEEGPVGHALQDVQSVSLLHVQGGFIFPIPTGDDWFALRKVVNRRGKKVVAMGLFLGLLLIQIERTSADPQKVGGSWSHNKLRNSPKVRAQGLPTQMKVVLEQHRSVVDVLNSYEDSITFQREGAVVDDVLRCADGNHSTKCRLWCLRREDVTQACSDVQFVVTGSVRETLPGAMAICAINEHRPSMSMSACPQCHNLYCSKKSARQGHTLLGGDHFCALGVRRELPPAYVVAGACLQFEELSIGKRIVGQSYVRKHPPSKSPFIDLRSRGAQGTT
ncbi:hypothetical protein BU15DRAFT_65703 [Melanogaster broomeanus]|nr:hypothetical protein BU15DRAFT_65703 [Melanogaster broomeanus]